MNTSWLIIIAKRFGKMFILGGVSSALITMASHPLTIGLEWRSWLLVIISAFVTGGLAAVEKWAQGYDPNRV